jgi:hypothetical protein
MRRGRTVGAIIIFVVALTIAACGYSPTEVQVATPPQAPQAAAANTTATPARTLPAPEFKRAKSNYAIGW